MKGLGTQDCAIQESMGPISDRSIEHLLPSDAAIVKIRKLLLQTLRDHADGKTLPGMKPESYRVRSARLELPKGAPLADLVEQSVRVTTQVAAE
jgi:phthalate 4,5-dioxygenase